MINSYLLYFEFYFKNIFFLYVGSFTLSLLTILKLYIQLIYLLKHFDDKQSLIMFFYFFSF